MNEFTLIRKNLFRNKLRAALMIVSILVAFVIFGVLAAFQRAFDGGEKSAEDDRLVVVNKINFTRPLPVSYLGRVVQIEGVRQASYATWFGGYFQDPKNDLIAVAVEPGYLQLVADDFDLTPEMCDAFLHDRMAALVGEAMAQRWGWTVGDRLPIASTTYAQKNGARSWDVTIVGVFGKRKPQVDTNRLIFRYDYFNETRAFGKNMIGWLLVQTTSPSLAEGVAMAIDKEFSNSSYETSTDTEKEFSRAFALQLGNIALVINLVVGAAFITILIMVGTTMMVMVRERSTEIAVLKVIGFPAARVLRLVIGETMLLTFIGGLPGLVVAAFAIDSIRGSLIRFVPGMSLDPSTFVMALALAGALGLGAGLIPAFFAFRLKSVDILMR